MDTEQRPTSTTDAPTTRADVDDPGSLRHLALDRIRRRRNFSVHGVAYVASSALLALVWAATEYENAGGWPTGFRTGRMNHDWDPWIVYPLIAGALAFAVHAWVAFGRRPPTESEIARELEQLSAR
jgi:hypothetical protein